MVAEKCKIFSFLSTTCACGSKHTLQSAVYCGACYHTNWHVAQSEGLPHSVWASSFVTDCSLLNYTPFLQDASLGKDVGSAADESDEGSGDEDGFAEDDNTEFEPGHGVEDMLRMLEEGGALPDIEGLMEAENAQVRQAACTELTCAVPCCTASLSACIGL